MSLNLTFTDSAGDPITTPFLIEGTWVTLRVTSYEEALQENLGVFLTIGTLNESVDYPSSYPPETDYEDLLAYGQLTYAGVNVSGGLKYRITQNDLSVLEDYFTHDQGATYSNRIPMQDLEYGDTVELEFLLETPPSASARRFFIDLNVEN